MAETNKLFVRKTWFRKKAEGEGTDVDCADQSKEHSEGHPHDTPLFQNRKRSPHAEGENTLKSENGRRVTERREVKEIFKKFYTNLDEQQLQA